MSEEKKYKLTYDFAYRLAVYFGVVLELYDEEHGNNIIFVDENEPCADGSLLRHFYDLGGNGLFVGELNVILVKRRDVLGTLYTALHEVRHNWQYVYAHDVYYDSSLSEKECLKLRELDAYATASAVIYKATDGEWFYGVEENKYYTSEEFKDASWMKYMGLRNIDIPKIDTSDYKL